MDQNKSGQKIILDMDKHSTKIRDSIAKLDLWLDHTGYAGFDPYDIKGLKPILKLIHLGQKNRPFEILRELVFELFNHYPLFFRKIFRIQPQINAKAMGLIANAYLDLARLDNNNRYFKKSAECISWLNNNYSSDYPGMSWGYPFDWQSKKLIPRNTPNGIVTTAVAEAYWNWYKYNDDETYLAKCIKICEFLSTLPHAEVGESGICFAYTPLFQNYVHNLNLFVAEFLLKMGYKTDRKSWIDLAMRAVYYTIENQNSNGSFDYNGPPESPSNFVDNYHTGFVLRMLLSIWQLSGDNKIFNALNRGFQFYLDNFFEENRIPKLLPDRKYRIDIHSCAESILCLSVLSNIFPQGVPIAQNVADWTIDHFQDPSGYFYYAYFKSRFTGRKFQSNIPYMRWGQAWMLKALVSWLAVIENPDH